MIRMKAFFYFTSSLLPIVYSIMNGSPVPFLLPKAQIFLQLSKDVKFGNWFVFEDYAEIRLYGADLEHFRLHPFVPMRMFC